MSFLVNLKDRWAAFQDRRLAGRASELLLLGNGRLQALRRGSEADCAELSPDALAAAATRLNLTPGAPVILLLPAGRFSTSEHHFTGLPHAALLQALHFQQDEYFPGMEPLVVAASSSTPPSLALWMRRSELERWRQALELAGLRMIAVGPAILLRQYLGELDFSERDPEAGVEAQVDAAGRLTRWSLIPAPDDEETSDPAQTKLPARRRKKNLKVKRTDYLFLQAIGRSRSGLGLWFLVAALVGVSLVYAIKPIVEEWRLRSELEDEVAQLKQQAANVLSFRGQVFELEERLKPVQAFPRISIQPLLSILDKTIPKDSWLTRLDVDESQLEIEGVSPDPSRIIELLSARPEFSEVAFSKAIRQERRSGEGKSHFGIRMQLSGIDFDAWRQAVRGPDE